MEQNNTTIAGDETCADDSIYNWYLCVVMLHAPVSVFVDRYVTPIWYFIGYIGNAITIKVWSRRINPTNTSALFLTVLAFTDLALLSLHVVMELKFSWNIPTIDVPGWCQVFFVLYMFAQYMSPLLILGFTFERFVSISMPFKSQRFSKRNRAPLEIGIITLLALGLAVPQISGWKFRDKDCQGTNKPFFATWSWISDILVFCVFPISSLVLNIFVMRAVSKSVRMRRESAPSFNMSGYKAAPKRTRIRVSTLTLLCVSFYRILSIIPVAILYILQYIIPYGDFSIPVLKMGSDPVWSKYFEYITAKKIFDEIGLSQYSCNIFIYIATAKYFRSEINSLLLPLKTCTMKGRSNLSLRRYGSLNSSMTEGTAMTTRGET